MVLHVFLGGVAALSTFLVSFVNLDDKWFTETQPGSSKCVAQWGEEGNSWGFKRFIRTSHLNTVVVLQSK